MNSYTIYGGEKWEEYFASQINDYLNNNGYDACIKEKIQFELDITKDISNWYGTIRKYIMIQNNMTKQFFVIDHSDQFDYVSEPIVLHPLCLCVLKCQYRKGSYGGLEHKISSFTYGVKVRDIYFSVREDMKQMPRIYKEMYFKGNECGGTGRGNILIHLAEMNLINENYGLRKNGVRNQQISHDKYLKGMASSKVALSLPGNGNCCHRELEAFGIGVPVLMPILKNTFYNKLVPNVHYIAVDSSTIRENRIRRYNREEENKFVEMVKDRYEEVANDDELLNGIAANAMEWFNDNIVFPSNIELMKQILLKEFKYNL